MGDFITIEEFQSGDKSNPIVFILADPKEKTGWYFYDEDWYDVHGPYDSYKQAKEQCEAYVWGQSSGFDSQYEAWRDIVFRDTTFLGLNYET